MSKKEREIAENPLTPDEATPAPMRKLMNKWDFERNLNLVLDVFKAKYGLELDAEFNTPRLLSGKQSVYYILFVKVEEDKILPLLRVAGEITEDKLEEEIFQECYENTLRLLLSDATIKEIFDKANAAAGDKVPEGKDSVDIPVESDGSESGEDAPKDRKSRKNKK